MATNNSQQRLAYSVNQPLTVIPSGPIISNRAPTANDKQPLATIWINKLTNTSYILTSVVNNLATWSLVSAAAGALSQLTAEDASVATPVAGDIIIDGDGNVESTAAGNTLTISLTASPTFAGTVTANAMITGDLSVTGDFDLTSVDQIDLTSSLAAANAIILNATAGGVDITSNNFDIDLLSTLGSINLTATENAAQAIYLRANGGVTETIQLHADQGTAVNSINLLSDVGGLTFRATGLASADAINLEAPAGGIDMDAALQINIDSAQAAADSIRLAASNVAGGITIASGTGGLTLDSTGGAFGIVGDAASNIGVAGAGVDLTVASAAGRLVLNAEEAAADAIRILSAVGGLDANVALQMNLDSSQAAADAVRIIASGVAGGIDVDAGTGGIAIDTTGALSLDSAAASNLTVTGAFDLTVSSTLGSVVVTSGEAAVDAILIDASGAAGGVSISAGTGLVNVDNGVVITGPATAVTGLSVDTSAGTGSAGVFTSASAIIPALVLNAGGILADPVVDAGGASPRVVNAFIGAALFSNNVAAGTNVALTVTNSVVAATSRILATATCATVGSAVVIRDYVAGAGTVAFNVTNLGGTDTTGNNVQIDFWILS